VFADGGLLWHLPKKDPLLEGTVPLVVPFSMTTLREQGALDGDANERPMETWGPYLAERPGLTVRETPLTDGACGLTSPRSTARAAGYSLGRGRVAGNTDG